MKSGQNKAKILVIVGPTASGKSDFAVELAREWNGEVVSADSRQIYKGLDIGAGKITSDEMRGIPHHMLDVASPSRKFNVEKYREKANVCVEKILHHKHLPIVCGGTGFYIEALVDNITYPEVAPNVALRKELAKKSADELLNILTGLDPERAAEIDSKNTRRIIRAIEIATALGKVPKVQKGNGKYEPLFIGLAPNMELLKKNIAVRLQKRMAAGMLAEARALHASGLSYTRMEELGLEYRYLARHLQGVLTESEMLTQLESEIWHYAKRQMTWFKRDKRIHWINPTDTNYREHVGKLLQEFFCHTKEYQEKFPAQYRD